MKLLLKNRAYFWLMMGRIISLLGDWILDVTLPVWIYQLTGSGLALGTVIVLQTLPPLLLSPIAGLTADKIDRRHLVIAVNLLFALSTAALLFSERETAIAIIYGIAVVNAVLGTFLRPSQNAILPMIVAKEDRQEANGLYGIVWPAMMVIGPLVGGLLFARFGPETTVLIDVVTFLIAAVTAFLMGKLPEPVERRVTATESKWDKILGGWRTVWQQPTLRTLLFTWGAMMVASGVVSTVLVPFVQDVLEGGDGGYGYIRGAQGIGMFLGGVAFQVIGKRWSPQQLFRGGMLAFGPFFILGTFAPSMLWAALCVSAMGISMIAVVISNQTLMQSLTHDQFRGRVSATFEAVTSTAILVGAFAGGLMLESFSARPIMIGAALLASLATMIPMLRPLALPEEPVTSKANATLDQAREQISVS